MSLLGTRIAEIHGKMATTEFRFIGRTSCKKLAKLENFLSAFGRCTFVSNCGPHRQGHIILEYTCSKDELVNGIVNAKDARKDFIEHVLVGSDDVAGRVRSSMWAARRAQWGLGGLKTTF